MGVGGPSGGGTQVRGVSSLPSAAYDSGSQKLKARFCPAAARWIESKGQACTGDAVGDCLAHSRRSLGHHHRD